VRNRRNLYEILISPPPLTLSKTYAPLAIFAARRGAACPLTPLAFARDKRIRPAHCEQRRRIMLDVMYLAIGFAFLAVAVLYVIACDRL
jgi:hypothetical protein